MTRLYTALAFFLAGLAMLTTDIAGASDWLIVPEVACLTVTFVILATGYER